MITWSKFGRGQYNKLHVECVCKFDHLFSKRFIPESGNGTGPVQVRVSLGFTDVDTSNTLRFGTSNVSEKVVATAPPSSKFYHYTTRLGFFSVFAFILRKGVSIKMSINGFKSFVCCGEDHLEDPHEMELLKEVPCGELRSLDDSNHWRPELVAVSSEGKEADPSDGQFEFGGEASSWLAVEPNVFSLSSRSEDEQTGDESVHMSSSSDVTSGETAQQSSPHDSNESVAEAEINAMLESTTDPVGKVCHTFTAPLTQC